MEYPLPHVFPEIAHPETDAVLKRYVERAHRRLPAVSSSGLLPNDSILFLSQSLSLLDIVADSLVKSRQMKATVSVAVQQQELENDLSEMDSFDGLIETHAILRSVSSNKLVGLLIQPCILTNVGKSPGAFTRLLAMFNHSGTRLPCRSIQLAWQSTLRRMQIDWGGQCQHHRISSQLGAQPFHRRPILRVAINRRRYHTSPRIQHSLESPHFLVAKVNLMIPQQWPIFISGLTP